MILQKYDFAKEITFQKFKELDTHSAAIKVFTCYLSPNNISPPSLFSGRCNLAVHLLMIHHFFKKFFFSSPVFLPRFSHPGAHLHDSWLSKSFFLLQFFFLDFFTQRFFFLMEPLFLSNPCTSPKGCHSWGSSVLSRWVVKSKRGWKRKECTLQLCRDMCKEPTWGRLAPISPLFSHGADSGHRWGQRGCHWAQWVQLAGWPPGVVLCGLDQCVNSKQVVGWHRQNRNRSCSNSPHLLGHGGP